MSSLIDRLRSIRVGIPGLATAMDNKYAIFNFGEVDQYLDKFEIIQQTVPGSLVIFNAYNDPYNAAYIADRLVANGIQNQCVILIGDLEFARNHHDQGFRFFSFFWHWWHSWYHQLPVAGTPPVTPRPNWTKRTHRLSCLNRNSNYSRFVAMYELQQQSWFDDVHSSFGNVDLVNQMCGHTDVRAWFHQNAHRFPYSKQHNYQGDNCWSVDVPAYALSYANLCTETYSQNIILSEKTIKPLVAGNLLFLCAMPLAVNQLRHMQFDMDFEGVNQSYDTVPEWRPRIRAMIQEIDRIYHHIPDIWYANLDRLQRNCEWALSTDFGNFLINDVKDIFPDVQSKI